VKSKYCLQVTEALAALHEAGWVHRDVKPQNILLQRYQNPEQVALSAAAPGSPRGGFQAVLTDFGSCCSLASLQVSGTVAVYVVTVALKYCYYMDRSSTVLLCFTMSVVPQ
jgi:serine/threonine protein kinase